MREEAGYLVTWIAGREEAQWGGVFSRRVFCVAGPKSEYPSALSSDEVSAVLDLSVSSSGACPRRVALQSKERFTTSMLSSLFFRLPSVAAPCPPAPVWFDASHVAYSAIPLPRHTCKIHWWNEKFVAR